MRAHGESRREWTHASGGWRCMAVVMGERLSRPRVGVLLQKAALWELLVRLIGKLHWEAQNEAARRNLLTSGGIAFGFAVRLVSPRRRGAGRGSLREGGAEQRRRARNTRPLLRSGAADPAPLPTSRLHHPPYPHAASLPGSVAPARSDCASGIRHLTPASASAGPSGKPGTPAARTEWSVAADWPHQSRALRGPFS
eukprot:354792-Chlamydomonas_euryale.AAC.9